MSESLKRTFKLRKTHSVPGELSPPPAAWGKTFSELADESELKLDLDRSIYIPERILQKNCKINKSAFLPLAAKLLTKLKKSSKATSFVIHRELQKHKKRPHISTLCAEIITGGRVTGRKKP